MAPSRRLFMGTPAGDVEIPALPETGAAAGTQPFFDGNDWQNDSYLPHGVFDFRLSLATGVPVADDATDVTTIYLVPRTGNRVGLYDGTRWKIHTTSEVSLALSGLTTQSNYDVFLYDNAGTKTLELLIWTNDTTRATALAYQDGVLVKSGATTRRYVGTIRTTGTTSTTDSVRSRFVWNYYNRVLRVMYNAFDTGHTYTTASWRAANGNTTDTRSFFVIGVSEEPVTYWGWFDATPGTDFGAGYGLDTTGAPSPNPTYYTTATSNWEVQTAINVAKPAIGYHYLSLNEYGHNPSPTFNYIRGHALLWA